MHAYKKALMLFLSMVLLVTSCSNKNKEKDKEIDRLNQLIERQGQKTEEPKTEELSELKLNMEKEREEHKAVLENLKLRKKLAKEQMQALAPDSDKEKNAHNKLKDNLEKKIQMQEKDIESCKYNTKHMKKEIKKFMPEEGTSPLENKCRVEIFPTFFTVCED